MIKRQRVIVTISRPDKVKSFRIEEGKDPRTILQRYIELEPGEQVVSATMDGKPIDNPSVLARQKGEAK